jgi:hypothetical protein
MKKARASSSAGECGARTTEASLGQPAPTAQDHPQVRRAIAPTEKVVLQWVDAAPAELHELRKVMLDMWRKGHLTLTRMESGDFLAKLTELGASVAELLQQEDAPVCSRCEKSSGVVKEFMVTNQATGSDVIKWMHEDCFMELPLVPKA